jgi:hypothetical protein
VAAAAAAFGRRGLRCVSSRDGPARACCTFVATDKGKLFGCRRLSAERRFHVVISAVHGPWAPTSSPACGSIMHSGTFAAVDRVHRELRPCICCAVHATAWWFPVRLVVNGWPPRVSAAGGGGESTSLQLGKRIPHIAWHAGARALATRCAWRMMCHACAGLILPCMARHARGGLRALLFEGRAAVLRCGAVVQRRGRGLG